MASYGELAVPYDEDLQDLVRHAAEVCETPIATVSVMEGDHQRFLAELGLGCSQTSSEESFCKHAMVHDGPFEVLDARLDERFRSMPIVVGPASIRFYFGVPVKDRNGVPVATICVVDRKPRELTGFQRRTLLLLARQVEARLEAMRSLGGLREERAARLRASAEREGLIFALETERSRFRALLDHSPAFAALLCGEDLTFEYANEAHDEILGSRTPLGKPLREAVPEAEEQGFGEILRNVIRTGKAYRANQVEFRSRRGRRDRVRYLDVVYEPYREADGTVSGVFAQGVDVTDCVLAQRALKNAGHEPALAR